MSCRLCLGTREVTEPAHEYTFMGRVFWTTEKLVACPECSVAVVRGVRTHQTTELQSIVPLKVECCFNGGKPVVTIADGGVTGAESVYFDDHFLYACEKGWWACAGTPGRWDSLFVPAKEMRVVFEKLGLT